MLMPMPGGNCSVQTEKALKGRSKRGNYGECSHDALPWKEEKSPLMSTPSKQKMLAAVLVRPREFELQEQEVLDPAADEVRIKVAYCGICSSNLAPWRGAPWFSYPFPPGAPGHESVGVVDQVGKEVSGLKAGQQVSVLGNRGFAEFELAKAKSVIPISGNLDEIPFLGEPLGCAINIFRRSQIKKDDWVAIVGTGFLGAILLQLSAEAGAKTIAISRRSSALRLAERMGAHLTFSLENRDHLLDAVRKVTEGSMCNVVIEAAGVQETLDLASDLTGTRGRLVIAGYHQDGPRTVNMQEWNWRGIDVINAHERDEAVYLEGIREAAEAVASARIRLGELVSHFFPLERIGEGFQTLEQRPPDFFKAVVSFC
jgi:2-desacetyl-2-hydroxyethyl bacteriochlorophyllide A dehydrogenase